jgi:hypothetical protein
LGEGTVGERTVEGGVAIARGVSEAHVREVIAIHDRVLRNYWVTQSYADLSEALRARLDPTAANWCTFAVWASKTVGENLRGEGLPEWVRNRVTLSDGMMGALHSTRRAHGCFRVTGLLHDLTLDHVVEVVAERFGATALALSEGNTLVYEEVAPVASRFLDESASGLPLSADARAHVLDACADAPSFEGVNRLAAGFAAWCDALETSDARARSQLILVGSLQIGVHEQHRLQDAIADGVDLGVDDLVEGLARRMIVGAGLLRPFVWGIERTVRPVAVESARLWDTAMTELVATADTPDGRLRLCRDIPALPPGTPFAPADVSAPLSTELGALLRRFDRSNGEGVGSHAEDWVVLDQRMNFILNLFRSRHHDPRLYAAPFDPSVLAQIQTGTVPAEPSR